MALDWLLDDVPEYISRGQRVMSVLEGSGTIEVLPGRPDVTADPADFQKGEKFNPDIDFDPNSFSRMDKFDGLEVGQEIIDSEMDRQKSSSKSANPEEK